MTTKQITGIAVGIFSIQLLISVFPSIIYSAVNYPIILDRITESPCPPWTWILIHLIAILVCLGALFILWKVSTSLIFKTAEEKIVNNLTAPDLMQTLFSCMGVYFLLSGILAFIQAYATAINTAQLTGSDLSLNINFLLAPATRSIFGILLIAKPRQWVKAIRSIGSK